MLGSLAEAQDVLAARGVELDRTSRTHSHKPLNLLFILFSGYIDLKNN